MFFPPNVPPEVLKKVIDSQRQTNKISNEELDEIKKMNEYKN